MIVEQKNSPKSESNDELAAFAKETQVCSELLELDMLHNRATDSPQNIPYPRGIKLAIIIASLAASVFLIALVCLLFAKSDSRRYMVTIF